MVGEASLLGLVPSVRYTVETRKGWCQTRGKTQSFGEQSVDCIPLGNGERGNLLMFFILESSFLLAIISLEETRAKHPPAPPKATVAGRPTKDRAEPKLALENAAERTLEPAALQLTNFLARLYFLATRR